jgi:hypothetical protein
MGGKRRPVRAVNAEYMSRLVAQRSMASDTAVAWQTREKGRLLDGRKWDYEPLAAIEFHVRIRGAPCVGFFSCHIDRSFSLGSGLLGLVAADGVGLGSIVLSFAGRGNADSGWFNPPFLIGSCRFVGSVTVRLDGQRA